MKALLIFLLSTMNANAFITPTHISCSNQETIVIHQSISPRTFYKRALHLKISESPILTFKIQNKEVAKLYPQNGLDFVIKNKRYSVLTDNQSYWKLVDLNSQILFSCELKND